MGGEGAALRLGAANPDYEFCAALVREPSRERPNLNVDQVTNDVLAFLATRPDVVIDALPSGPAGAALISAALDRGVGVVTANKQAIAGSMREFTNLAEESGAAFCYSASVGGGAPFIETIARARKAGDIAGVEAVLNGTVNFILTSLAHGEALAHREVGLALGSSIASLVQVECLSFGLMDFVSAHGGAIPASAMGSARGATSDGLDQFSHPLVLRAKLEIASACHAHGKVPSHCVVTEFNDVVAVRAAARRAAEEFGYTRMWSIHPAQIRPILEAFAPSEAEIQIATTIVAAAIQAAWAPIQLDGKLHDRASYRYYWQVLERAHRTGRPLPEAVQIHFQAPRH